MERVQDKAAKTKEAKPTFPIVPTTKILAIGQFTRPPTPEQIKELFPKEVPATLQLYLAGKIDQWWIRQTQTGPVFLLNVTSLEEARALMEELRDWFYPQDRCCFSVWRRTACKSCRRLAHNNFENIWRSWEQSDC